MSIRAEGSPVKLLNVIKNPVSNHLPTGCRKYLMTYNTDNFMMPEKFASMVRDEKPGKLVESYIQTLYFLDAPLAIVIGGIARGKISTDYTEMDVKISNYPLSAALVCAKMTTAFENLWEVEQGTS
jgi:rRNA small subunit pseudouridine methyltransferase Nep1